MAWFMVNMIINQLLMSFVVAAKEAARAALASLAGLIYDAVILFDVDWLMSVLEKTLLHWHLVGIGGAGMGALAEILLGQGHRVTGSDRSVNATIKRLQALGAEVVRGHHASLLLGAHAVVYSTAIAPDNPELVLAKQQHIPLRSRGQLLADLMAQKKGIAVAGTHGKTTTTSLLTHVLLTADMAPSFAIGGILQRTQCNGCWGEGKYLIAEADESDASFMLLHPEIAIVTNIDEEHMHTYDHDFMRLSQSFLQFLQHIPAHGMAVLCWEDEGARAVSQSLTVPYKTYGLSNQADVWASDIVYDGMQCHFVVHGLSVMSSLPVTVALPGVHNILNALAVLSVAAHLQIPLAPCQRALQQFCGVGRRSQYHGICHLHGCRYHLLEDYGHHPREIEVTIDALKHAWPKHRLVLIYQPHRYTRTQALWTAFCQALAMADVLLLCGIYAAGEQPIPGFDSQVMIQTLRAQCDMPVHDVPSLVLLPQVLQTVIQADDVVLLQGAGTIHTMVDTMKAIRREATVEA